MVMVALTGRRLGRTDKWPYTGAAALPYRYVEAVLRAGGQPVIVNDARDPKALMARVDALILTGGPDVDPGRYGETPHPSTYGVDRADDDFECAMAEAATVRSIPTLAICRGIQILNVARGGTLHQHIADDPGVPAHGQPGVAGGALQHQVMLDPDSLVADVMGATTITASCHHHQAIAKLGDGLRVVGRAHDKIVEALELDGTFLLAVQWHPEDTADTDPAQQRLFDALVRRAAG
ncbi:MAG: putative glutamine amidotransferase [Actinomycetia bacterium]|nr:putative glutamine amidotransferase [Actinomycetes bacterium]